MAWAQVHAILFRSLGISLGYTPLTKKNEPFSYVTRLIFVFMKYFKILYNPIDILLVLW